LQCADIIIEDAEIKSRDGVAIDHATNTAIAHKKFSYEVMEYGEYFDLNLEITFREIFDPAVFKRLLLTIFNGIQSGHIRLGAKTNKGFGRLTVGADKIHMAELSFANKNHVWQWLSGNYRWNKFLDPKITPYDIRRKQFKIDAWFSIRNSLLIKAYSGKPEDPDAVPIKQAGKAVMPGTSVMGAVRHRAKKILKTLGVASVDEKMRDLFGFVDDEHRESEARKGRVLSEETLINNVIAEVQTRIKIDRFTGGTIHGALFEMMPLWQQNHGDAVHLMITLNDYHDWEAALFLFILKDLWAGDLPIGGEKNVGRGVLQGLRAEIIWDGKSVRLQADAT
jgi:CRISPR/Cas system CSM-associated protein Csm3 (group 7 of RAMP superfamily)